MQSEQRGHHTKALPAATIDLWGSDPLMCFSVLVLIKPSFASVQIYKALFFLPKILVMWSERHKYPPHFAVVTSPSAIDSSNKCLEGAICAFIGCQADALECHLEKCICVVGAGLKK